MYRRVEDFLNDWEREANSTIGALKAVTDDKLDFAIVEGHNSLGWIGWHIATAPLYFAKLLSLPIDLQVNEKQVPKSVNEIVRTYDEMQKAVKKAISAYSDEELQQSVNEFGREIPKGNMLFMVINHQTHHRGQMTVLLRQAGLKVPGVMGPTAEDGGYE